MAVISEIIKQEPDGSISFGNHLARDKQKKDGFDVSGDIYKVRTYKEVTRLEKNDVLLLESIPGCSVFNFRADGKNASFKAEGNGDTSLTVELTPETEYTICIDGECDMSCRANKSGKISFSTDLSAPKNVKIQATD